MTDSHIWMLDSRRVARCIECGQPLIPWWKRLRERVLNWWASR